MSETLQVEALAMLAPLFWTLALLVSLLSAHVAFGCLRNARYATEASDKLRWSAGAVLALGTGLLCTSLLCISGQALPFAVGYQYWRLAAAWVIGVAACALALLPLLRWPSLWLLPPAAAALAGGTLWMQVTVIAAIGLSPGLVWSVEPLVVSMPLVVFGAMAALWIVLLGPGFGRRQSRRWRWAAALALAITYVAGQVMLFLAGPISGQASSDYVGQLPAVVACMIAGMVAPTALLMLEVGLRYWGQQPGLRRRHHRHHANAQRAG
jgi:NO-binding membrane sensor protein with MHYT domain